MRFQSYNPHTLRPQVVSRDFLYFKRPRIEIARFRARIRGGGTLSRSQFRLDNANMHDGPLMTRRIKSVSAYGNLHWLDHRFPLAIFAIFVCPRLTISLAKEAPRSNFQKLDSIQAWIARDKACRYQSRPLKVVSKMLRMLSTNRRQSRNVASLDIHTKVDGVHSAFPPTE